VTPVVVAALGLVALVAPEVGLGLLVFSGNFENVALGGLKVVYPIFACTGIGLAWILFRRHPSLDKRSVVALLPGILIGALLVLSVAWSPAAAQGLAKALKVWAAVVLGAAAALTLSADRGRLRRFVVCTVVIGAAVCGMGLLRFWWGGENAYDQGAAFGETYILYGRGALALLVACLALLVESTWGWRTGLLACGIALAVVAVLESASRAALGVGALISVGLIVPALSAKRCRRQAAIGIAAVLCGILIYWRPCILPRAGGGLIAVARTLSLGRDPSLTNRIKFYHTAIVLFSQHPVAGVGSEGFPALTGINYPHNFELEVAAELGLLGLALLAALAAQCARGTMRAWPGGAERRAPAALGAVATLLLAWFLTAQFSYNVNGNRMLFVLGPVLVLCVRAGRTPGLTLGQEYDGSARVATEPAGCALCGSEDAATLLLARDYRFGLPQMFPVRKCCRCGLVYLSPRPTRDALSALYAATYSARDGVRHSPFRWLRGGPLRRLWAAYSGNVWYDSAPAEGRILDVGCMHGHGMKILRDRGLEVEGLEPNPQAAEVARGQGLAVRCADLHSACLPSNVYDTVVMSQVLEHTGDPAGDLREAYRILSPGGLLWVSCPNFGGLLRRIFGRFWAGFHVPYHLQFLEARTLRRLLEAAGFRVVRIRTRSPDYWATISARTVLNCTKGESVLEYKSDLFWRIVSAPVLRLVDAVGLGDCLVSIARKPYRLRGRVGDTAAAPGE